MGKKDKNAIRYDRDGIQKVMRIRDYFADSLGMFSLNIISGLIGQLTYFYTDKVGLAAGAIATVFIINRVIDAFTDLIMGSIVDNTPAGKEKYRPWLLKAGVPAGLLLVAMFTVPTGADWFRLGYVMIMNLLLTSILYTAVSVPYTSLQIVRTRSQEERSNIGTWRAAAGYVSGMVISIMVIPVTNILGGDQSAWIKLASVFGALIILSMLICYKYSRESAVDSRQTQEEAVVVEEEEKINFKESLGKLLQNKYWVLLLIINFASQVSFGLTGTSGTYYAKWIYGNDNLVAVMGGLGLIPSILGFILLTPLVKKFGPTKLLKVMALIATVLTAARILNPYHFVFNTAIGLVTTFTNIPVMALTGVLMAMVVDYNDYKFGIKMVGRSSAAQSFANKIGTGIGSSLVGWCLAVASYNASMTVASEAVRQAIFTFSIYVPLALNLIIYLSLRKFDLEGRMVEIYAAIAARRSGGEESEEETVETESQQTAPTASETISSPIEGTVLSLSDVNDPVFSNGVVGQGLAIKPTGHEVYAPADGEITLAFATGHALTLKTKDGAEVFVHIGINTVTMDGDGFKLKVKQGDQVKEGDLLGTFDSNKIIEAGLDDTTMVIIANTDDYKSVSPIATGQVKPGDNLLSVKL
ncbi:glycoside-pentoside-hexuronide (GPH):cation symporter [Streptococcus sp. KHUD_018]